MNASKVVAACGLAAACLSASAAQVVVKTSGVFYSGSYDNIGLFSASGSDLGGYEYSFEVVFDRNLAGFNGTEDRYDYSSMAPILSYSMTVNGRVVSQQALTSGGVDVFFFKHDNLSILSLRMGAAGPTSSVGTGLTFLGSQDASFPSDLMPGSLRIGMNINYQIAPSEYQFSQVQFYNLDFVPDSDGSAVNAYSLLFTQVRHVAMSTIPEPSSNMLVGLALGGAAFITRRSQNGRAVRRSVG